MRVLLSILALAATSACASMTDRAAEALRQPGLEGTRFGLVVETLDGRELVAIRPDERFTPASNTKLFTVAAAFARLGDMSVPDPQMGTSVEITRQPDGSTDINLVGRGDAMVIDADDCQRDCLSSLADMVVANGIKEVHDVWGTDELYPRERWGPGWSQEDLAYRSGAPASALSVNSNEVELHVTPELVATLRVRAAWRKGDGFYPIDVQAVTVEGDKDTLRIDRDMATGAVTLYGSLGVDAPTQTIPLAVDNPPLIAARRFAELLRARGVEISGDVNAYTRALTLDDDPKASEWPTMPLVFIRDGTEVARLLPPPLIEDVRFLMKQSQNQHAEMLLRRLGLVGGMGSRAGGLAIVEQTINASGAPRWAWDLSDGSGMSVYNRVTPRMMAGFLRWTQTQSWAAAYRDVLPIGGVDGTLARRFKGTPLEGRIFAKTGTLASVNALSGFMLGKSGRMLVFSAYANDRPSGSGSALAAIDAALVEVAEAN